ncbi:MAG: M4 family metallopeptidase, partial [Acidobacteria bacterium]|nr:M4 family metallopeptidase [Acidobacteriota bacterium]
QCGVHGNSGIANLAFYLLSQGGFHPRRKSERSVSGIGIVDAAAIYYRAQTVYLGSTSTFADMKTLTRTSANDLFGSTSNQARQTTQSWCTVGIGATDCLTELTASGTTFASKRWATLTWKYADTANVDIFRDGVKVLTTPNDGSQLHSVPLAGSAPTANYWVCDAGSTTWYDSNTCSNVVTVVF